MFERNSGFRLFDILGFKVSADWSWLVIAVLLSWSLATGYYPAVLQAGPGSAFWGLGALSALLLFFSVVLHEVGHSYVARNHGIRILGIRLFIFGGVAQMDREPQSPIVELKVALAGPAVSALLAAGFFLLSGLSAVNPAGQSLTAISGFLAQANLAMVVFNMIPGFPMDGGRVLRAILWKTKNSYYAATKIATDVGRYVAFGFMGLGGFAMLGGGFGNGLWLIFIGMFLYQAAKSNQMYAEFMRQRQAQEGPYSQNDTVEVNMSVQRFVDAFLRGVHLAEYPVYSGGRVVGLVSAAAASRVPWPMRRFVSVGEIMQPQQGGTHTEYSEPNGLRYKIFDRYGREVKMRSVW